MLFPEYASPLDKAWRICFLLFCGVVFAFLVVPVLAIMPLSFNAGAFLTYPLEGLSLRWYEEFVNSPRWLPSVRNSIMVAAATTAIATPLGTLAALGLMRARPGLKPLLLGIVISPMIVPGIIIAIAIYFLYAPLGLTSSYWGLILAHTVLATPFVVVVVHATLQGLDPGLAKAGASLGAPPTTVFFRVTLPLIAPGVLSGALFAFMTSFDEIVIAIFIAGPAQRTVPLQMFEGIREEISPTITAAATLLIVISVMVLTTAELLRRRGRRMSGEPRG
jgi:putative spermidine/putrescine transport system permease protein